MKPRIGRLIGGIVALLAISAAASSAYAVPGCPFCAPSKPPYSERLATCQVAVEVKWVSITSDKNLQDAKTTFEVVKSYRPDPRFKENTPVTISYARNGKPGELFLMLGFEKDGELNWDDPISLGGEYLYAYIRKVPPPETADRLSFFLKFLEFPDAEICADAYAEFSRASFKDVAALAPKVPRQKLRAWLASDDPQIRVRLGLYGMMLGLCGDDSDAEFLEKLIMKLPEPDQPRFGVDGMMAGYILIQGERGLQKLMDAKLADRRAEDDLMLIENALVFLRDYCPDRIPSPVVCEAMRRFIDHPKLASNVVKHLARWKDWQSLDRLIAAYGKEPFDSNFGKQQIVIFALVCEKDGKATSPDALPTTAIKARQFLDGLDPKIVRMARGVIEPSRSPSKVE
jgi:hypothetical protein